MASLASKTVLVTVGTTKFDELVKEIDTTGFAEVLQKLGYTKLLVQRGAGAYIPNTLVPAGSSTQQLLSGFSVE